MKAILHECVLQVRAVFGLEGRLEARPRDLECVAARVLAPKLLGCAPNRQSIRTKSMWVSQSVLAEYPKRAARSAWRQTQPSCPRAINQAQRQ